MLLCATTACVAVLAPVQLIRVSSWGPTCVHLGILPWAAFALCKLACTWPVGMGAWPKSWVQGPGWGLHWCIAWLQAGGLHRCIAWRCRPGACTGALWGCRPEGCTGAPCHGQAPHRCIAGWRPAPVHSQRNTANFACHTDAPELGTARRQASAKQVLQVVKH